MTSIQSNNSHSNMPPAQGLQANAVAFNEEEAAVLAQMLGAGVLSGATVGAFQQTNLGGSSLGLLGLLQYGWQDEDRLGNLGYKFGKFGNRMDVAAVNKFYFNKDGATGQKVWNSTASKHGFHLSSEVPKTSTSQLELPIDPQTPHSKPTLKPKPINLASHTVDADGNVLRMTKVHNGRWQQFRNTMPRLRYDNRGTFGDSTIGGHLGPVAESASQYAKLLRELEDLKVVQKKSIGTISRTPEQLTAFQQGSKSARATKIAAAQKQYLALDQIRLEEASKALKQQQNALAVEQAALNKARTSRITGSKLNAQEARVEKLQRIVDAQQKHVIKLNAKNAQFVATNTANNIDTLTEQIMKDPNWRQKTSSPLNPKGAKTTQLEMLLVDHGFSKEQLKTIQEAIATGSEDAVKEALQTAAKDNATTAKNIAQTAKTASDVTVKKGVEATVKAKSAAGAVRNNLGLMGKVTKGLAIVGTALEVLNFGNNMKNGDHRKAATDLTTAVLTTAGTTVLAAMFLSGVGTIPAMLIAGGVGMGLSAGLTPLVDKGFQKFTGLTNKNERDEKELKSNLQKTQQVLASAPTAIA